MPKWSPEYNSTYMHVIKFNSAVKKKRHNDDNLPAWNLPKKGFNAYKLGRKLKDHNRELILKIKMLKWTTKKNSKIYYLSKDLS